MKKYLRLFLSLFILIFSLWLLPQPTNAAVACGNYNSYSTTDDQISINIPLENCFTFNPNTKYRFRIEAPTPITIFYTTSSNRKAAFTLDKKNKKIVFTEGTPDTAHINDGAIQPLIDFFNLPQDNVPYKIKDWNLTDIGEGTITVTQPTTACDTFKITNTPTAGFFNAGDKISFSGQIATLQKGDLYRDVIKSNGEESEHKCIKTDAGGNFNDTFTLNSGPVGTWVLRVFKQKNGTCMKEYSTPICTLDFCVGETCITSNPQAGQGNAISVCDFAANKTVCRNCFDNQGVYTPFGCISTKPQTFVEQILKIAIGLGGGIAFLMIIYGGFMIMMSSGNPEKLNAGKEIITSAISGLLLIVFSIVILKIIGVDIFNIPGLN